MQLLQNSLCAVTQEELGAGVYNTMGNDQPKLSAAVFNTLALLQHSHFRRYKLVFALILMHRMKCFLETVPNQYKNG